MKIKERSMKRLKYNLRFQSIILLDRIMNNQGYSNVVINDFLQMSELGDQNNRLLVQIVYGVVQRDITLNYLLKPYIEDKKVDDWVELLLKISVFQMIFLDRIPDHAIVNEAVEIAKTNGHQGLGKFVNAILRAIMRDGITYDKLLSSIENKNYLEQLSIQFSMPQDLIQIFRNQMDDTQLEYFLKSSLEIPHMSIRINPELCTREEALKLLTDENYLVRKSTLSPNGIVIESGNILKSKAYKLGLVTIQDESSMLVAPVGNIKGDEKVLDACSAPGGKATHIAALLSTGHLTALDIYQHKLAKVSEHLHRMKLQDKISLIEHDALTFETTDESLYDRIYLDAPCSGLGLIRRKPEIKYRKTQEDIVSLVQVQMKMLHHLISLLKPGGMLIYSTCTLSLEENEQLIRKFCQINDNVSVLPITEDEGLPSKIITPEGFVRVWPHQFETDGFFIGRLMKH